MVARGEVYWAYAGEAEGRRPVVVLTRTHALDYLTSYTVAPITSKIRNARSQVPVGREQGLPRQSVINCDGVITIPRISLDPSPIGAVRDLKLRELDRALRYALGIRR